MNKIKFKNKTFTFLAIIAIMLTGLSTLGNSMTSANAGVFCKSFGSGMGRSKISMDVQNSDSKNREWTVQELFSGVTSYTSYYGEGESTAWLAGKVDRGKAHSEKMFGEGLWDDSTVQANLEKARGGFCGISVVSNILPNFGLSLASSIMKFTSFSINLVLGSDFMIKTLVEVIGGDGQNTGLISVFLNSIYLPLVTMAGLLLAISLAWKGLAQRKLREAFQDIIWALGASIIGMIFMFQPKMMAEFPQTVATEISSCVIGAITGQNCLTGEVQSPSLIAGKECISSFGDSKPSDSLTTSMSCTLWKTFVLEEWAQEQFGTSYNNLYTYDAPKGANIWDSLQEGTGEKYCINLGSKKSADESQSGALALDEGNRVCNVALYQLYLKSEAYSTNLSDTMPSMKTKDGTTYDERWYDIIVPMAKSGEGWGNWTGEYRAAGRFASGVLSVLSSAMAAWTLIVLSMLGATYKVTAVIVMAFAPIFLLMAIEPTRGRSIFLGWLETIVSSMLKYFAITLMVIISLTIYSAVLNNITGFKAVISVIVIAIALNSYRKEVIDIIGAANMGGKRLSNKVGESFDKAKKRSKRLAGAAIGGAVGAQAAQMGANRRNRLNKKDSIEELANRIAMSSDPEEKALLEEMKAKEEQELAQSKKLSSRMGSNLKASVSGAGSSAGRVMKRGTGVTAMAFQQKDRTARELKSEEERRAKDLRDENESRLSSLKTDKNKDNDKDNNDNNKPKTWDSARSGGLTQEEVEKVRKDMTSGIKNDISEEEKASLDKLTEQLKVLTNQDLMDLGNNEEVMADDNRKKVVATEVNARIKALANKGQESGVLGLHTTANLSNMTESELKFKVNYHKDNFLETGDTAELAKYKQAATIIEKNEGGDIDPTELGVKVQKMENSLKQTYERNNEQGVKHTRSTPGSSALVDQYNKDEHERVEYAKKSAAEEAKKAEKAKDKDDGDKGGGSQGGNQGGPATPATPEPAKPKLNQKKHKTSLKQLDIEELEHKKALAEKRAQVKEVEILRDAQIKAEAEALQLQRKAEAEAYQKTIDAQAEAQKRQMEGYTYQDERLFDIQEKLVQKMKNPTYLEYNDKINDFNDRREESEIVEKLREERKNRDIDRAAMRSNIKERTAGKLPDWEE